MPYHYDWPSVLRGKVKWRVLYREIRHAYPDASWLLCLWWTLRWPHYHDEEDYEE